MDTAFPPTRAAGLEALSRFVPRAGAAYAAKRNYDLPDHPHVSRLSPYIRHRLVTEDEVLRATLARHSPRAAQKFIQEVFWRTYWKGWLERRPSVWAAYKAGVAQAQDRVATEGGLRADWEAACLGQTGLAPFDHWAHELVRTGYMHNHARMWFASIWIFTLRLPWELGADVFLRHLLDGDAASNTLSWRWVAGLQTRGKVYTARSSNISKYTEGRFGPLHGLEQNPTPLDGAPTPPLGPVPQAEAWDRTARTGLLLTEDDLSPSWLISDGLSPSATAVVAGLAARSPLAVSAPVRDFTVGAIDDALARYAPSLGRMGPRLGLAEDDKPEAMAERLVAWAQAEGLEQIVAPYPPVGPGADTLIPIRRALEAAGLRVAYVIRPYDSAAWPHATHGFFRFKEKIPSLIAPLIPADAA